jgi:hypothetical protein
MNSGGALPLFGFSVCAASHFQPFYGLTGLSNRSPCPKGWKWY